MKTTDELVAEMADREAIRDIPVRYCDHVWQGNLEGVLDLFAEDGAFIVPGREREVVSRGREELRKMYQRAIGDLTPRPYIHNHVVNLQGKTRATGRCYVELRSAARQMEWIATGYYDDEYVKVGEHWKFATRRFTSIGMPARPIESGSKP
ncbi:MAG TPA: nuclear transport factor 2 family protein [Candidatus Binataceae bacterium]|nr:nuclear transport factor 2 family protein [Candidatus Binataceae bacterium]